MNGTVRYRKAACLLCGLLTTVPLLTRAVTENAAVILKLTVVAPPCVINNNQAITVEFGDVVTTQVDGSNYKMPLNYTLSCPSGTPNAMKLQVVGPVTAFDSTVLWTNKNGLGIQLLQGSTKLPVNTWLNFTYPNKPELWAVPVKQSGVTLEGGEFAAAASMKVDYQ